MGPFIFLALWGLGASGMGYAFYSNSEQISARARRGRHDFLNTPRGIKIGGALFMVIGPVAVVIAVVNIVSQ